MKNDSVSRYLANRRRFLRDAGLTSLGVVIAACAPAAPAGSPAAPAGALKKGGEFHGAWPYVLPPAGHWNGYAPNGILTTGIYRHLWLTMLGMYRWADNKYDLWLADTAGLKGTDSYEVKIKSGIKWSDGKALTAQDVYTTFNVGRLYNFTLWNYVDRMDLKDDSTISFHVSRPSSLVERLVLREPIRPASLYGDFSKQVDDLVKAGKKSADQEWKDLNTKVTAFRPTEPVSVGPYKIDPKTLTEARVDFVRNPGGYNADVARFDKVVVYQGETAQVTPLVLSQDVDYATHGFPLATDKAFQDAGIRVVRPSLYTGPALYWHWEKAPEFQDVRLRYAVASAINREESGKITYGDSAKVQKFMAGFSDDLVPQWISSGDQGKLKPYAFDLSKAEGYMKDAGYAKGSDGIWAKGGKKLELELVFPSDFADWASAATHAAESLTKFGIKVTARGIVSSTQLPEINDGKHAFFVRAWGSSGNPHPQFGFDQALRVHNTTPAGGGMKYPLKQKVPSSGKEVDLNELIIRTAEGFDVDKQKAAVTELALIFNELLPVIPLWQRQGNNPVNDKARVTGWPPDSDPVYKNPDGDSFAMKLLVEGKIGPK
ncbi:MAG TPA: ABC transporter substrate-binding protein [Candidatus Limnocylindria bacterium]